jgi:hypothetical protein
MTAKRLGVIAAALAIGVLATGTAHADTDQLLGITVGNNLDAGYTPAQAAQMVFNRGDASMDSYSFGRFVAMAIRDLCPWHLGQGFNESQRRPGGAEV